MPNRSSTFNFETWRRLRTETHGRCWRLFAVVLALLLTVYGVNATLAALDGHVPLSAARFEHLSEHGLSAVDVKVIVLGDSTEKIAIDAAALDRPAVNLSINGSGYEAWWPIFEANLARMPDARILVLSADPMSILRDGLGQRRGDLSDLVELHVPWWSLPGLSRRERVGHWVRTGSPVCAIARSGRLSLPQLRRWINAPQRRRKIRRNRFTPEQGEAKKRGYADAFREINAYAANATALDHILALARERDMHVVLVRTPVVEDFKQTEAAWWEPFGDEVHRRAARWIPLSRLHAFDGSERPDYGYELFKDPNHLNRRGAAAFTDELNAAITSLYDSVPQTAQSASPDEVP